MGSATVAEKRQGRPGGLTEIYERTAPAAVRLAFLITSDPDLAQDIAQEAFARVTARFHHLRVPDAFDSYLRRTVVNLCTSHFRHERVVRAALLREEAEAAGASVDVPDLGVRDQLWTALHRLPARQRAAVVLRYYEDRSDEQIAEAMRCSRSAARSLVSHGVQTLRTLIGSEER